MTVSSESIPPTETLGGVAAATDRLLSVDVLRGFDMFWIIGAEGIVHSLSKTGTDNAFVAFLSNQMRHVPWEGFHFYDLIFPLFVFIIGVSIVLSMDRIVEKEGKAGAMRRIVKRGFILYLLNLFYYGGIGRYPDPGIRLVGVLQRLAFTYVCGALLYCNFKLRGLIVACAVILVGYWAAMTFIPAGVPGHMPEGGITQVSFEPGQNLAHYVDYHFLPGRRLETDWDPEGLLSAIPAVGSCLLGIFAGMLLKSRRFTPIQKVAWLAAGGVALVLLGSLWGLQFPVIKKLWTSSYVLVAGGYSALLLAFFYLMIDVLEYRRWAAPFVWIGSNALTVYLAVNLIDFDLIAERFVGGPVKASLGSYGDFGVTAMGLVLAILLTRWMYHRKIFIKV
ncbi:MAG: DUF1624 domain-containing protein [Candidatus Hydrogenedentes bacterium]|nr:DUF1624 domain-containing protein [Candidatus Hydrogenedentota bacterium]